MSISSPRTSKGKASRSEGVIKLHSQEQLLDLLLDTGSKVDNGVGREVLSPSPLRPDQSVHSRKIENQSPIIRNSTRNSTVNYNLHQRTLEEKGEREVLSVTPPKVISTSTNTNTGRDSWLASRARHRRSQTRGSSKESVFSIHPQPLTSINFNPSPRPITRQQKTTEIPTIPISQKDKSLPPISWRRTSTQPTAVMPTSDGTELLDLDVNLLVRPASTKLPSVQHMPIFSDRHDTTSAPFLNETYSSPSPSLSPSSSPPSSPPLSPNSLNSLSSLSISPPNSAFSTTTPSHPTPSPPPSPKPSPQTNLPVSNPPHTATDESTMLSLAVLRQHHHEIEEVLARRVTLLKTANHLLLRNGGLPAGIPFAVEYLITCGDVAVLVDVAKSFFCIAEDGGDDGGDEEGEEMMDGGDYTAMAAWLSAIPMMMTKKKEESDKQQQQQQHVVVGLRVVRIVVAGLEQWVDTAIGIAQSLGPDAIPDELREQCYKYNEYCRNILPCVERIERKGRVGVLANEVYHLVNSFLEKSLPL